MWPYQDAHRIRIPSSPPGCLGAILHPRSHRRWHTTVQCHPPRRHRIPPKPDDISSSSRTLTQGRAVIPNHSLSGRLILTRAPSFPRCRPSPSRGCCYTCNIHQPRTRCPDLPMASMVAYRINTRPNEPVCFPSINSSVSRSKTFMYESMLSSEPLYSVWPHFKRMMTSLPTLWTM